jgi:hypothetical protein
VAVLSMERMRGVRDRALVLVGFGGAFCRSEFVALDVGDLTFDPARGVVVRVRRSKTDQLGEGADVAIPFGSHPETWPVRALQAWRAASVVREGALFRAVDRHGRVGGRLDGRDVARVLKEFVARAGIALARNSGYSTIPAFPPAMASAGFSALRPRSTIVVTFCTRGGGRSRRGSLRRPRARREDRFERPHGVPPRHYALEPRMMGRRANADR